MREQTADYIIENHKSATSMAEKMGIDTYTVCRLVRDYRRKYDLPSYSEEKGQTRKPPQSAPELRYRVKELKIALKAKNLELAQRDRRLAEEKEKVEILKKSLHIFMQAQE